jgi:hypothetical protein
MRKSGNALRIVFLAATGFAVDGCNSLPKVSSSPNPIVGTWVVKDPNAPFPYHMYVFNGDRTMQQANPDAGDPQASDSDGKGIWVVEGNRIKGKWVEVTADRTTHRFSGRFEMYFDISVNGDSFAGAETARAYDANGNVIEGPATPAPLEGKRVSLP